MAEYRVGIIGAGIAGLVAALELSANGIDVTVFEKASKPGGKLRQVSIAGRDLDAGPTVFTMSWVFEKLFEDIGHSFTDHIKLTPLEILARHAWDDHNRLDLFHDIERSVDAISNFAGPREAQGYKDFCSRAKSVYDTLEASYICASRPSVFDLVARSAPYGWHNLLQISPFTSLWDTLHTHFRDERLQQLFARYSTYCGSSPFHAPATLMLIAHVEQQGVWSIDGGMYRLAEVIEELAISNGASFIYDTAVVEIIIEDRHPKALLLSDGEVAEADLIIVNADTAALANGILGRKPAYSIRPIHKSERSLSAITWAALCEPSGFDLTRHNVFFSADYSAEFRTLFDKSDYVKDPTVYVCAQDRLNKEVTAAGGNERVLCLINAPPTGDTRKLGPQELRKCEEQVFEKLMDCGLQLKCTDQAKIITTPYEFDRLYPGTGGALYGQSSHGWGSSFSRPGTETRLPGLYLAGGSTHPGAGVPMAAISGRLAAARVMRDIG